MRIISSSRSRVKGRAKFEKLAQLMESVALSFSPTDAFVEVNLVGERRMAELNRVYRRRRGASEVLTFSYTGSDGPEPDCESPAGEIYLCWQLVARGARKRRVSDAAYLLRLLVHGLCHIQGYRHDDEPGEKGMEEVEKEHLRSYVSRGELARLFS